MTLTSASAWLAIMPRRVDLPTPLPAKMPRRWPRPHGTKVSSGLDAGAEDLADALALQGMGRLEVQGDVLGGLDGALFVERIAESVKHTALQLLADGDAQGGAEGDDFAAGMDAVDLAQRHEEDVMVAEAHDFGEGGAVVARGFDAADFADGDEGAFGLDDQADQLDDAAVVAEDLGLLDAAEEVFEPVDGLDVGLGQHARSSFFKRSNLVSRRPSTVPKLVSTRQPPRETSGEGRKRKSWPSAGVNNGEPAFCRSSRSARCRRTVKRAAPSTWARASRTAASTMAAGNGEVGDEFLRDGQGEGNHGVFGVADDLGDGLAQGLEETLNQLLEFGALLEEFFAENFFAVGQTEVVAGLQFRLAEVRSGGRSGAAGQGGIAQGAGKGDGFRPGVHCDRCTAEVWSRSTSPASSRRRTDWRMRVLAASISRLVRGPRGWRRRRVWRRRKGECS